jgi:hypothetical protein
MSMTWTELDGRPLQIGPPASHLEIDLIGEPPAAGSMTAQPGGVDVFGREPLYPAIDGDVIDGDVIDGDASRRATPPGPDTAGRTAGTSGP